MPLHARAPELPAASDEHRGDEEDDADERPDGEGPGAQRPGHACEHVVPADEQDQADDGEEGQQRDREERVEVDHAGEARREGQAAQAREGPRRPDEDPHHLQGQVGEQERQHHPCDLQRETEVTQERDEPRVHGCPARSAAPAVWWVQGRTTAVDERVAMRGNLHVDGRVEPGPVRGREEVLGRSVHRRRHVQQQVGEEEGDEGRHDQRDPPPAGPLSAQFRPARAGVRRKLVRRGLLG